MKRLHIIAIILSSIVTANAIGNSENRMIPITHETQAFSVSGRVFTSPGGTGIQDQTVYLWHSGDGKTQSAVTSEDGSYVFENVKPSQYGYVLKLENPAGCWTDWHEITVTDRNITDQKLYTSLPQVLSGTVHDADSGQPVKGAGIRISTRDNWDAVTTDTDGNFRLYMPRKITIECDGTSEQYWPAAEPHELNVEPGQKVRDLNFTIKQAPRIFGVVIGNDGTPAADIPVDLTIHWNGDDRHLGDLDGYGIRNVYLFKTDEQGQFTGYLRRPFQRDWDEEIEITAAVSTPDSIGSSHIKTNTNEKEIEPLIIQLYPTTNAELGGGIFLTDSSLIHTIDPDSGTNNGLQIRLVIPKSENEDLPVLSSQDQTAQLEVKNISDMAIRLAEQNTTGGRRSIAHDWVIGLNIGAHTPDKAAKIFFRADDQDDYWSRILNAPSAKNINPGETAIFRIQLRRLVNDEGINLLNLQGRYDLQPVLQVQDEKFGLWHGRAVGGNTPVIIDPAPSDKYSSSAILAGTDQNGGEPVEGVQIGILEAAETAIAAGQDTESQSGSDTIQTSQALSHESTELSTGTDNFKFGKPGILQENMTAADFSCALLGSWRSVFTNPRGANIKHIHFSPDGTAAATVISNGRENTIAGTYQLEFEREPHPDSVTLAKIKIESDSDTITLSRVNFGDHNGVRITKYPLLRIDKEPYGVLEKVLPAKTPTVELRDVDIWGEPVEGTRIGILEAGQVWGRSDWPYPVVRLKLMARNEGHRYLHLPENGLSWQIEVNGNWYEWVDPRQSNPSLATTGPASVSSGGILRKFNAGNSHLDLILEIAGNWRKIPAGKETEYAQRRYGSGWVVQNDEYGEELILKEDQTYQIRIAIPCPPSLAGRWDIARPVSNPVEITIQSFNFSLEDLEKSISWGEEIDGLQIGLKFDFPRNQYYRGEQVVFSVYAHNKSDRNVTGNANISLMHFGLLGYTPTLFDSHGNRILVSSPPMDMPVRKRNLTLEPGDIKRVGSVTLRTVPNSNPNDFNPICDLPPGTYSVQQRFVFQENEQTNWHGELTTGTLTMRILPAFGIEPLPEDKIDEMFKCIEADEDIDLKLIYQSLIGPQYTLRAYAARFLGTHGDRTSIAHLIDALADKSLHVGAGYLEAGMATTRYWANDSLKKLTGRDFGFVWNDPLDKRNKAIERWRKWWQKNKNNPDVQIRGDKSPGELISGLGYLSNDEEVRLREIILKANEGQKRIMHEMLLEKLNTEADSAALRQCMVYLCMFRRDKETADAFVNIMNSNKERSDRKLAASFLKEVGSEDNLDALLQAIKEDKGDYHGCDIARAAYESIVIIGGEKAADILLQLRNNDEYAQDNFLLFMAMTGSEQALHLIHDSLEQKDRQSELNAMAGLDAFVSRHSDNTELSGRLLKLLRKYVRDDDPEIRLFVIRSFLSVGQAEDIPLMNALTKDPYHKVVNYLDDGIVKEKIKYPIQEDADWAIVKINSNLTNALIETSTRNTDDKKEIRLLISKLWTAIRANHPKDVRVMGPSEVMSNESVDIKKWMTTQLEYEQQFKNYRLDPARLIAVRIEGNEAVALSQIRDNVMVYMLSKNDEKWMLNKMQFEPMGNSLNLDQFITICLDNLAS